MPRIRTWSGRRAWPIAASIILLSAACQATATASPSPSSGGMTVALRGDLHAVDGEATGAAELVSLPDGSYEIVLDGFSIAGTDHLNVVLVKANDVSASADVDPDALLDLGALQGTSGMQAYPVPPEMSGGVMGYHTVLIWDTAMLHVIAAAPLGQS